MAGIVVVFDFDLTILDCESDYWVVDQLSATDLFNQLLPTMPLNSLMDRMMMENHSRGKTIEDIAQVLKRVPWHPRIVPTIKAAHALGCDLSIVSDAKMLFIDSILEHPGIKQCFSEIKTNPAYVDDDGRLRVLPYHDFITSPHGCILCPPKMCKGKIMEGIQNSICQKGSRKSMIYVGDGSGDYCPSLKLRETNFVMPRKDFPVWHLICTDPSLLKAQVHEWSDGQNFETVLLHLIRTMSGDQAFSRRLVSSDCKKLHTLSVSAAQDPLPLPLPLHPTIRIV